MNKEEISNAVLKWRNEDRRNRNAIVVLVDETETFLKVAGSITALSGAMKTCIDGSHEVAMIVSEAVARKVTSADVEVNMR